MALETLNTKPAATETTETEAPLTAAKTPTTMGKGAYLSALPTAAVGTSIPPELLKNMQEMIAQREKQKNSLNEAMRDATAWWSGGQAGPGEALARRAAEREGFDSTTFGMKSALAQYNAAAAAAANRAQSLKNEVSPTGGAGTTGTAPTGLGMPANVASEINRLLSLNPPDVAAAEALRSKWAGNESKFDAARHTQQTYYINPEIGNVNMDPEQAARFKQTGVLPDGRKVNMGAPAPAAAPAPAPAPAAAPAAAPATKTSGVLPHVEQLQTIAPPANAPVTPVSPTGVNAFNVGNVRPQGSSTGFQQPKDINEGLSIMDKNLKAYGDKGINTLEGVISRWSPPNENDTPALIKSAAQRLGIDPKQPLDLSNPAVRQAVGTAIMLQEKGPKAIFAAAPATTVVPPVTSQRAELMSAKTTSPAAAALPYPVPRNSEEVKANQEYIKKRGEKELDIASKGPEKAGTEAGGRQAQMFKLNDDADKAIEAADQVIAASKSHPESVGLGKGFTGTNALTTAISVLPKMDQGKAEERVASFTLSPEALAARDQIDTASKQLGISFAADVFKGARMGIGLENMAAGAKGVSVHNLAENNLINATLIKEAALFNKARTEMFKKWAENNGGKMADFEKFETSPEYIELKKQTQQKLVDSLPNYLKLSKDGLVQTKEVKTTGAQNEAKAELERRKKAKGNQ